MSFFAGKVESLFCLAPPEEKHESGDDRIDDAGLISNKSEASTRLCLLMDGYTTTSLCQATNKRLQLCPELRLRDADFRRALLSTDKASVLSF